MDYEEEDEIMKWIDRNSKPNGYVTEIGLRKLIRKMCRESSHNPTYKKDTQGK